MAILTIGGYQQLAIQKFKFQELLNSLTPHILSFSILNFFPGQSYHLKILDPPLIELCQDLIRLALPFYTHSSVGRLAGQALARGVLRIEG